MRPLVKGPARGGGTELLKKGRLLLLLSKALQCWNASKWEAHWTMFSNKLQDVFPFALIKLGIVTDKNPDWSLKRAFLENVQFGIPIVRRNVIQYFLLKSCCDCKSWMFKIIFFLYLVFCTLLRIDILLIGGSWLTKYQMMIVIVKSWIIVEKILENLIQNFTLEL